MSVEERGRLPSRWTQFWFGAIHWLSCGLCSRDSTVSVLPITSDDSSVQSPKPPEIQIMQPGVLCLTDLYTRAHSSEQIHQDVQQQPEIQPEFTCLTDLSVCEDFSQPPQQTQQEATCLMDLNDDCLLEIIDCLDIKDRLCFRVNRRLKSLEPAAVAIANTEKRMKFFSLNCRVDGSQVHIEIRNWRNRITWSGSLPLESGLLMFIRAIKCCRFKSVDLELPMDLEYLVDVFKALRFLKSEFFKFTPIGTYCPDEQSQHIVNGIISAFRNNKIDIHVKLDYPQAWASFNQLLTLIQMTLEYAQKMGKLLMGIDPALFADPPRNISAIRTSIKDKEVYVFKYRGTYSNIFRVSVKSGARRIRLERYRSGRFSSGWGFYLRAERFINCNISQRVPYRQAAE